LFFATWRIPRPPNPLLFVHTFPRYSFAFYFSRCMFLSWPARKCDQADATYQHISLLAYRHPAPPLSVLFAVNYPFIIFPASLLFSNTPSPGSGSERGATVSSFALFSPPLPPCRIPAFDSCPGYTAQLFRRSLSRAALNIHLFVGKLDCSGVSPLGAGLVFLVYPTRSCLF